MRNNIQLKSLTLTNFGRHESLRIDLSSTLTVIKGPNGAGKSTLLQAIFFAFGGVSAVDGSAKDIPRHGSSNCEVVLRLFIGAAEFSIGRTLKDAGVYEINPANGQGTLCASGHTAVNAWIEERLGVAQKTFLALAYSPQTETAAIMSIGAAALNRMVEQIAEVDFITAVEKQSSHFAYGAQSKLAGMEAPKDVGELRVELTKAQDAEATAAAELVIAEDALERATDAYKAHGPKVSESKAAEARRKQLNEELVKKTMAETRHQASMEAALEQATKITVTADDIKELLVSKDTFADAARLRTAIHTKQETQKQQISTLRKKLASSQGCVERYEELKPKLEAAKQVVTDKGRELNAATIRNHEAYSASLDAAKAVESAACSTCKRPFDAAEQEAAIQRNDAATAKHKETNAAYVKIKAELTELTAAYQKLLSECPAESDVEMFKEREKELQELESNAVSEIVTAEILESDRETLAELIAKWRDARRQLESKEQLETDYADASEKKQKASKEALAIKEELENIPAIDLTAIMNTYDDLFNAYTQAQTDFSNVKKNHTSATMTVAALSREIERSESLIQQRALLERRSSSFDGLTKYLRNNRATFMSDLWEQLMALTSRFVSEVTNGRIEQIGRTDDGAFFYVEDGKRASYARLAGGFKAIAGVGLRLALASLLPSGVSLTVLDEPSSELRDDMAAALAGALRASDRQIIMVTHRIGEEYTADSVVELEV